MSRDIDPRNTDGSLNGYCELYYLGTGQSGWQGIFVHGKRYGCHESYLIDGIIWEALTGYFIDDVKLSDTNESGYCLIWDKDAV